MPRSDRRRVGPDIDGTPVDPLRVPPADDALQLGGPSMRSPSLALCALLAACGVPTTDDPDADGCATTADTTATDVVSDTGCAVLERDTSACDAERAQAGLDGAWRKMSCRVALSVEGDDVVARSDGRPDYQSNYFPADDACHVDYDGAIQNPNVVLAQDHVLRFPRAPNTTAKSMQGTAIVGMALNGVPIFGNFAAPGDDIFEEARTFDACGAHPQNTGVYHYHSEPTSITQDDDAFVGFMADGYAIYGRRDADGSTPELDAHGGHVGPTADATDDAYHYHVHAQTNDDGETQYFLTTGTFHGTP
jgi:hypothetical protein